MKYVFIIFNTVLFLLLTCNLVSAQKIVSKKDSLSLISYLSKNNIQARLFWNALSSQIPYKKYDKYLIGVSKKLSGTIVSIPCSSSLKTSDQERVIELIMKWKGSKIICD